MEEEERRQSPESDGSVVGLENSQPGQELIDYLTMWKTVLKCVKDF